MRGAARSRACAGLRLPDSALVSDCAALAHAALVASRTALAHAALATGRSRTTHRRRAHTRGCARTRRFVAACRRNSQANHARLSNARLLLGRLHTSAELFPGAACLVGARGHSQVVARRLSSSQPTWRNHSALAT